LQRQPYTNVPEPPTGWYIDYLLPSINGDLAVERGRWADLRDSGAICAAINTLLAEEHQAH
jgi:hypothetical protein